VIKGQRQVHLALGSNLGDRLGNLRAAIAGLEPYIGIAKRSSVYETAPAYVTDQPKFLNAAISGFTDLEPMMLLHTVKEIERRVGRMPTYRYGPRVVDIDIIFYDDEKISHPELTVPHPRMHERSFVLCPLKDIAADYRNPITGKTVGEMLANVNDAGECVLTGEKL